MNKYSQLKDKRVLIVEDTQFECQYLIDRLTEVGCIVDKAANLEDAECAIEGAESNFDIALVDILLPDKVGMRGEIRGPDFARILRKISPATKIVAMSQYFPEIHGTFYARLFDGFLSKSRLPFHENKSPTLLYATLEGVLVSPDERQHKIFIVHGHDTTLLLQLKDFLQNKLNLGIPTVLRQLPAQGKTVIERFEQEASDTELVFVLLTPDDPSVSSGVETRQSRQNVIFELGFFYAKLQRTSGRIILIKRGPVELPSDIHGITCINMDNDQDIESVSQKIRDEIRSLGISR